MSIQEIGIVKIKQGIVFQRHEASLNGEGSLVINLSEMETNSLITLPDSVTLNGIELWEGEDPLFLDDEDEFMLVLRSEGVSFISHNSGSVTDPKWRCSTSSEATVFVDKKRIQIFFTKASGSWKWEIPDWNVPIPDSTQISFSPANGAQWVNPDPTTVSGALNRITARITNLALGLGIPIP